MHEQADKNRVRRVTEWRNKARKILNESSRRVDSTADSRAQVIAKEVMGSERAVRLLAALVYESTYHDIASREHVSAAARLIANDDLERKPQPGRTRYIQKTKAFHI